MRYFALEGLTDLVSNTLRKVRAGLNPQIRIEGLLRYHVRPAHTLANRSPQVKQHFGDRSTTRSFHVTSVGQGAQSWSTSTGLTSIPRGRQAYLALARNLLDKQPVVAAWNFLKVDSMAKPMRRVSGADALISLVGRLRSRPMEDRLDCNTCRRYHVAAWQISAAQQDGSGCLKTGRFSQARKGMQPNPGAPVVNAATTKSSPVNGAGEPHGLLGLADVSGGGPGEVPDKAHAMALIENIQRGSECTGRGAVGPLRVRFGRPADRPQPHWGARVVQSAICYDCCLIARAVRDMCCIAHGDLGHGRRAGCLTCDPATAALPGKVVDRSLSGAATEKGWPGRTAAAHAGKRQSDPDVPLAGAEVAETRIQPVQSGQEKAGTTVLPFAYGNLDEQLDAWLRFD